MSNDLTNLLPPSRQRLVVRDYYFRLGVIVSAMIGGLIIVAGVLLIPTYVFLNGNITAKQAHLAQIRSSLSSSEEYALASRLAVLSGNAAVLKAVAAQPSVAQLVSMALTVPRPGIAVSGFTYTPADTKTRKPATLALSGVAATRDALRGYQLALEQTSFASAASLPVSAYAKDANIPFVITITIAP